MLQQAASAAAPIAAAVALLTVGSLVPILKGSNAQGWGPFTSDAETTNGRTAVRARATRGAAPLHALCRAHAQQSGERHC